MILTSHISTKPPLYYDMPGSYCQDMFHKYSIKEAHSLQQFLCQPKKDRKEYRINRMPCGVFRRSIYAETAFRLSVPPLEISSCHSLPNPIWHLSCFIFELMSGFNNGFCLELSRDMTTCTARKRNKNWQLASE